MNVSDMKDGAPEAVQQLEHTGNSGVDDSVSDEDLMGTTWSRKRFWNSEPLNGFYVEALNKYPDEESIDPEEEKKLVRKIDWLILPWFVISTRFSISYCSHTMS